MKCLCVIAASKGFWAQALGVGDFYYEVLCVCGLIGLGVFVVQLGVQIVEICLATRERNGGKISCSYNN